MFCSDNEELNFQEAARFGALISREYARDFLRLLVAYKDISASEAASRLDMHIKTAQDFLDGMTDLEIVSKREVDEGRRPYYRYRLEKDSVSFDLDFRELGLVNKNAFRMDTRVREKKNAGANYATPRGSDIISSVTIWTGSGRSRKERRINLTRSQGMFLHYLPFPTADFRSIGDIMRDAVIGSDYEGEVLDIVLYLAEMNVLDVG